MLLVTTGPMNKLLTNIMHNDMKFDLLLLKVNVACCVAYFVLRFVWYYGFTSFIPEVLLYSVLEVIVSCGVSSLVGIGFLKCSLNQQNRSLILLIMSESESTRYYSNIFVMTIISW